MDSFNDLTYEIADSNHQIRSSYDMKDILSNEGTYQEMIKNTQQEAHMSLSRGTKSHGLAINT